VKRAAAAIRAVAPDIAPKQLLLEVAFVLNARHGLRLVSRFDAFVSVELHTDLAGDVEQTVAYGRRFHAICPERFYVKVPFTPAGLLGARRLQEAGIPVNLTLGFSARQNYLIALFTNPSFVNVFMGRLNAFVADNKLGDGRNVGEKATLATQRELLTLRREGKTRSRLIGASMRDGSQVGSLAGVDVFTMPPKVAAQYHEHPLAAVMSQVNNDAEVSTAAGIRLDDYAGGTLWEVPLAFKRTVESLLKKNADQLKPDDIVRHFQREGFGDFLPTWASHDRQTATADGKIPVYAHWKDRLASGKLGLDALMNLSAFHSFVTDQTALDNRVRSLVQ
jgi:transaldolase